MATESIGSGQQAGSEIGRPRLLQRVHEAIRVRHYSRRTEEAYVHWMMELTRFRGRFGAWVTSGYPQAARGALDTQPSARACG